ncbi:spore coat protein U [Dickeya fangzhongdai]|uniref:Csu type fimbrial protein n=1 Tax=Dickeya fangzhongdai TaxID=1778540 RepID=UPI0005742D27|nr:spore coat U domain-containing protein [Dickeya fangzhongdai]KHN55192.1 spore coat protein U [Dickeya fangzhongdai]
MEKKNRQFSLFRFSLVIMKIAGLLLVADAVSETRTATFKVSAAVITGCAFGTTIGSSSGDLGTIDFGTHTEIPNNLHAASGEGAGSIVVTCTPGSSITIALDYGQNGGGSSARYLKNTNTADKIAYQLYQDANYSAIWGTGALAYSVNSFPETTQRYTVYARLFGQAQQPVIGTYTDKVTVTISY